MPGLFWRSPFAPSIATAGEWPDHPIHFIVPFPAGGSTDVAARVVGDHPSHTLGQQVVVENKSGANGNIGMEYVAKSAPDGYTILIGTDSISSNPHVHKMAGLGRKVRGHLICRPLQTSGPL